MSANVAKLAVDLTNIGDCFELQKELISTIDWIMTWNLTFNVNKCI